MKTIEIIYFFDLNLRNNTLSLNQQQGLMGWDSLGDDDKYISRVPQLIVNPDPSLNPRGYPK